MADTQTTTLTTQIKLRRDSAKNLAKVILAEGEPAFALDTKKFVIGDGKTTFANLADLGEEAFKKKLDKIQSTLQFNQLITGHYFINKSFGGRTFTDNGDGTGNITGIFTNYVADTFTTSITINPNHVYYYSCVAEGLNKDKFTYVAYCKYPDGTKLPNVDHIIFKNCSYIGGLYMSSKSGNNIEVNIKLTPILIDLTEMFGIGYEPLTVAEAQQYIRPDTYFPYQLSNPELSKASQSTVQGPDSSINNAIVIYDGTDGKKIKTSSILLKPYKVSGHLPDGWQYKTTVCLESNSDDGCFITSKTKNTASAMVFGLRDDHNEDYWSWEFDEYKSSGYQYSEIMRLKPTGNGAGDLIINGKFKKQGGTNKQVLLANGDVISLNDLQPTGNYVKHGEIINNYDSHNSNPLYNFLTDDLWLGANNNPNITITITRHSKTIGPTGESGVYPMTVSNSDKEQYQWIDGRILEDLSADAYKLFNGNHEDHINGKSGTYIKISLSQPGSFTTYTYGTDLIKFYWASGTKDLIKIREHSFYKDSKGWHETECEHNGARSQKRVGGFTYVDKIEYIISGDNPQDPNGYGIWITEIEKYITRQGLNGSTILFKNLNSTAYGTINFKDKNSHTTTINGSGITTNYLIKSHQLLLNGTTASTPSANSDSPKITFSDNGAQPVHLVYTDYDDYRHPAGLKILGGANAAPAWFEVEGDIYGKSFIKKDETNSANKILVADGSVATIISADKTGEKNYNIAKHSDGSLYVNVPWTDTNTIPDTVRYISCPDTRHDFIAPNSMSRKIKFDFLTVDNINHKTVDTLYTTAEGRYPGKGGYAGVMTWRRYGGPQNMDDWSGGPAIQIAYDDNGMLSTRVSKDSATWKTWKEIAFKNDIPTIPAISITGTVPTDDGIQYIESFDVDTTNKHQLNIVYKKLIASDLGLANTYRYKGTKSKFTEIQAITDAQEGDVWNCEEDGMNYAWVAPDTNATPPTEGVWDALGSIVDLSGYVEKPTNDVTTSAIALFANNTGTQLKNSKITVDNTGNINIDASESSLTWNTDTYRQRIKNVDDASTGTHILEFQQSTNGGSTYETQASIRDDKKVESGGFIVTGKDDTEVLLAGGGTKVISSIIDEIIVYKSVPTTITTEWQDLYIQTDTDKTQGIIFAKNIISSGTYAVSVMDYNTSHGAYDMRYSGIMTWFSGVTNSGESSEIYLHNAGCAPNGKAIFLRTISSGEGNNDLRLQVAGNFTDIAATTLTVKLRKLI